MGAVLDQERVVVVTGEAESGKTRLLRGITTSLMRNAVRVVSVSSPGRLPLDLRGILDQVIDPARADEEENRVRRFCGALTQCQGGERQVALVIDDADVLTPRAIEFLEIIAGAAEPRALPLHIILVGRPHLWDLLSRASSFGPDRIARCFVLPDLTPPDPPEPQFSADEARRREQALSSLWSKFGEAVDAPAPAGTALAISRPAAEIFRFGGTPSRPPALSRARPTKWLAAAVLLAAPSTGALYGSLQFRPAATLAGFVTASGVVQLVDRFNARRQSIPETAAPPSQPPTAAAEPTWRATIAPALAERPSHGAISGAAAPLPPLSRTDAVNAGEAAAAGKAMISGDIRAARTPEAELPGAAPTSTPAGRAIDLTAGALGPSLDAVEAKSVAEANPAEPPPVVAVSTGSVENPGPEAAKVAEAVATPPPPSTTSLADLPSGDPPELLAMLISRGNALLKTGDVGGARLMYEQAARFGSRDGAVAAGRTYDPNVFDYPRGRRTTPDKQAAAAWYRQALAQGDRRAAGFLAQLGGVGE